MLSNSQKILLKELSMNPDFAALLENVSTAVKRDFHYKPDDKPEDKKIAEWAYYSGVDRGVQKVLELLSYERRT